MGNNNDTTASSEQSQDTPPLTPAQKALDEPDMFDSKEVAATRERLIERLNDNLGEYFQTLQGIDGKEIAGFSSEIAVMTEAHYYLTEMHNFHTSELEYLMQFKNPLQLVADEFEADGIGERSTVMWRIFDRQEHDEYELVSSSDTPATMPSLPANAAANAQEAPGNAEITALHERLIERAEQNWHDYRHSSYTSSPDTLFQDAVKTIGRRDALDFIKNYKDFTAEELNCLLQFADPVDLVADYLDPAFDISVMPGVLENILEEQENFKQYYPLAEDTAVLKAAGLSFEDAEQLLQDRLADNFAVYKPEILDMSREAIFNSAAEIAAVCEAFDYFSREHIFDESEVRFLLKFENPLEYLSDKWDVGLRDLSHTLDGIFNNQERTLENGGYTLISGADEPDDDSSSTATATAMPMLPRQSANEKTTPADDKPSVMAQLQQARQASRENPVPPKDPLARNKSEPDL